MNNGVRFIFLHNRGKSIIFLGGLEMKSRDNGGVKTIIDRVKETLFSVGGREAIFKHIYDDSRVERWKHVFHIKLL